MKKILNNNITTFIRDIQEAIQEGYRIVPNKSYLTSAFLFDIDVYQEDVEIKELDHEAVPAKVVVEQYDPMKFLFEMQSYIVNGYIVNLEKFLWLDNGSKVIELENPLHPGNIVYTREELDAMEWEEIKQVGKFRQCFNRNRNVVTTLILKAQEDNQ